MTQVSKPHYVIRPTSGWRPLDLGEVWRFRDLLLLMGLRDVKLRYRQTILGILWVLIQPLVAAGIFTVLLGRVARFPSEGVPYFAFAFTGQIAWSAVQLTVTKASSSLVEGVDLISKVAFPRLILPLSVVMGALLDTTIQLIFGLVMLRLNGISIGWPLLTVPLWLAAFLALALGVGLSCATWIARYRDVRHVLPIALQLLMFASPVVYATSVLPPRLQELSFLNPLTGLLMGFRWALLNTPSPRLGTVVYSFVSSLALLYVGAKEFKRREWKVVDYV